MEATTKTKDLVERYQEILQRLRQWIETNKGPDPQDISFRARIFHDDSLSNLWTQKEPDGLILVEWVKYKDRPSLQGLRIDDLQGEQNRLWDLHSWAPMSIRLHLEPLVLSVKLLRFDEAVRQAGLGRQCLNLLQQTLTRQIQPVSQSLVLDYCHFPLFYTADSQYGWLPTTANPIYNHPSQKHFAPASLFPRYWIYKDHDPDVEMKIDANEEALWHSNLAWCTPLEWTRARLSVLWTFDDEKQPRIWSMEEAMIDKGLLDRWIKYDPRTEAEKKVYPWFELMIKLNSNLGSAGRNEQQEPIYSFISSPPGHGNALIIGLAELSECLSMPARQGLAERITKHCLLLGNDDNNQDSPLAMVLTDRSFSPHLMTPTYKSFFLLLLAYLIDHGRVLHRPLVLSHYLVLRLCLLMHVPSLQDLFVQYKEVMPRPAPYFMPLGQHWIWVPVKKPHCCPYEGRPYILLPEREAALYPEDEFDDESGPGVAQEREHRDKRPRKSVFDALACHMCGQVKEEGHHLSGHLIPLCGQECLHMYYKE